MLGEGERFCFMDMATCRLTLHTTGRPHKSMWSEILDLMYLQFFLKKRTQSRVGKGYIWKELQSTNMIKYAV